MAKNFLIKLLIGALAVGGIGLIFMKSNRFLPTNKEDKQTVAKTQQERKISYSDINVCEFIPKELIEEAIGRQIVKIEWVELKTIKYCSYYTHYIDPQSGGSNIVIGFSNEDYEKIKQDLSRWENEFVKDSRISADHYLIKDRVGKVWEVDLFLTNNWYLGIKSNHGAASGEELIKIALKILEEKKDLFGKLNKSQEKEVSEKVPLPQDTDVIYNLANLIEEGRPDDAVKLMKTKNDSELQAWAVQFSQMISFKILKIEKADEENWTSSRHIYKVIFDVKMDPRSADAPIPYYGWENGQNTRWLTLEKIDNVWKISEIASGY